MPYQGHPDGLYLLRQRSHTKGVDHYGILDIGPRLHYQQYLQPVVIHQTPPSIRCDWLQNTGEWTILGKIEDEAAAIARIHEALANPGYDLFGNNCEHFARFIASGRRESTQLQAAVVMAGAAALAVVVIRSEQKGKKGV